ncbi:MAG: NADH-quinone oxidoreductase subunit N [Deltaproteobacteria bacterium]|nr:NADH-quinone oxidoreductase subunit N [Deltaproteobacteria bacterium]
MTALLPLLLPLLVLGVILLVLVADLLLPATDRRAVGILAAAGVAGTLAASLAISPSGEAFGGSYVMDELTLYLDRVFLAAAVLGILAAIDHADRHFPTRQGEYYLLLLASLAGMLVLAGARDLVLLVVAFETAGMPLYLLAALPKSPDGRSTEAALKYYFVGAASTAIALYGLSLLYGAAGTTRIAALGAAPVSPLLFVGVMATFAGMAFKIGLVPFHFWVPDTYEGASTPFVAFLSVAPKAAGYAALLRILHGGLLDHHALWLPPLLVLSAASMILGNVIAIPQGNVKRLLAGSGIAQVGTMLLAFAVGTAEGVAMLLFYLAAYVFTNMGAFVVQSVMGEHAASDDMQAYRGLARTAPGLALAMLLFLLSLAGIPFMAGFWAKLQVFIAVWHAHQAALVILAAVLAVMALFYYLRVARAMYIEPPPEGAVAPVVARPTRVALIACVLGTVGLGVFPEPFVRSALDAAALFLGQ